MKAVLAIVINMGVLSCPDIEGYWKTSWECYIPFFHDVMGRNRFQEIFWNLHVPSMPGSELRIDKVRLLLDHIRSAPQSAFYPHKEVAVDETMVGFRGRVSFLQYLPKKPTKYGLKLFVLADSSSGQKDGSTISVTCPAAVPLYNRYMGGVDRNDQLRKYYHVRLKCRKYYRYIFWFLFEVSVTNSYILHTHYSGIRKQPLKEFRLKLAKGLIGDYNSKKRPGRSSTAPTNLPLHHFPMKFTRGPEGTTVKRRCWYCLHCRQPQRCRETVWYCQKCQLH